MKTNKQIELIKKKIMPILKKNKVVRAGIFGSYARGEQKKNSDVDILVEIKKRISLFDFAGKKISVAKINTQKDVIHLNNIPSGVYNLRISIKDKAFNQRIVVNK